MQELYLGKTTSREGGEEDGGGEVVAIAENFIPFN